MLYSMTGFASDIMTIRDVNYSLELKTLNSKGFEFHFKSSSLFKQLEIQLKNHVQQQLERGKIELNIYSKDSKKGLLSINTELFEEQYNSLKSLADYVKAKGEVFPLVIQNYSNLTETEELNDIELNSIIERVDELCKRICNFRIEEGAVISKDIRDWLSIIEESKEHIASIEPKRIDARKQKLMDGMKEIISMNEIDYNRLGQEMIYYIEKLDLSEEISRLSQHIQLFDNTLNDIENMGIGKKLGFIVQEMGREINTIGSKANEIEIQHKVVEMKDQLEKIKEQISNVL